MKKRGNFKLFDSYNYYLPDTAQMFILLALLLFGGLLGNVITLIANAVLGAGKGMEYGMLIAYPLTFIPAMIYARIKSTSGSINRDGKKLDSNNFKPLGGFVCALLAIVATLFAAFCTEPICMLLPPMPEFLKKALESLTTGTVWINFLMVSIFAPFFEEWLCRGTVLRGLLNNNVKPVWAIIISAAFFAVIHLNPWQAIPAFLLGSLFGYVYYKTGSLKLTMLMHFTNNTFSLLCSNIPALKEAESWKDVIDGNIYWILVAACLLGLALCILEFRKITLKDKSGNSDPIKSLFNE